MQTERTGTENTLQRWTPGDLRVVRAMFERNHTDAEIGETIDRTARAVRKFRQRHGLLRTPPAAAPVADSTLAAFHREGLVNAEIARRTGLTVRSVQQRLHELGLASNRPKVARRRIAARVATAPTVAPEPTPAEAPPVAEEAPPARRWVLLTVQAGRGALDDLERRAEAAGLELEDFVATLLWPATPNTEIR